MAERVRIAYVADTTVDPRMIEGLAARAAVTLVVPAGVAVSTWAPEASFERVAVRGSRARFLVGAAWWLWRRRSSYDAIIALDNVRAALAANLGGRLARRPVVLQLGRPTVEYYRVRGRTARTRVGLLVLRAIVSLNERSATAIGAISEHVASFARRHSRRVRLIPWYGVDTGVYAGGVGRADARARLGIDEERPLLLFRSRMAHEKDPTTFLRAVALLRARGRDVAALYVGGEFRDFVAMAQQHGVPVIGRDHVHPTKELPLFYAAADLTVQASHAEGLGMSPLESLAMGTPIVVTAVGGLIEAAAHGAAGTLVAPRDPAAMADAIGEALDDGERTSAQVAQGRALIAERYEATAVFDAWIGLIGEVSSRARRADTVDASKGGDAA